MEIIDSEIEDKFKDGKATYILNNTLLLLIGCLTSFTAFTNQSAIDSTTIVIEWI